MISWYYHANHVMVQESLEVNVRGVKVRGKQEQKLVELVKEKEYMNTEKLQEDAK